VALTNHHHLAPRLKKEYIYSSNPLAAFIAGYRVNFTVFIPFSSMVFLALVLPVGPNMKF
jgi:hypothetical protein